MMTTNKQDTGVGNASFYHRIFGRAIHSLSKIGDELYVEPLEHGLALRTVNSSRSAYACFLFSSTFFQHYDDGSGEICSQDSEEDAVRCKISMKSCLTVFKSMASIEKTVERCQIVLNMEKARLIFKLHCKHGIVKTHNLAFIECETLQAVFSKDMSPNKLTAQARLLCDAVVNFQNNLEEVTVTVTPEKISLRNYVEDEPDPTKVMHTVLNLDPAEFDNCHIGVDTSITFCLKELRAILTFAEALAMPLNMQFESAGRPVVFTIDADSAFEANFVLATLADVESQGNSQQPTQNKTHNKTSYTAKSGNVSAKSKSTSANYNGHSRSNVPNDNVGGRKNGHRDSRENRRDDFSDDMAEMLNDDFEDEITVPNIAKAGRMSRENSNNMFNHPEEVSPNFQRNRQSNSPMPSTSKDSFNSPLIPNQSFQQGVTGSSFMEDVDADEDEELVPGTPPKKKFHSMFFGSQATTCSQVSQNPNRTLSSTILAEDTDEED